MFNRALSAQLPIAASVLYAPRGARHSSASAIEIHHQYPGRIMKWISAIAGVAFFLGLAAAHFGRTTNRMNGENREALMLYGIGICVLCGLWLAVHGVIVILRRSRRTKTPESGAT